MARGKVERPDVNDAGILDRLRVRVMPPRVRLTRFLYMVFDFAENGFGGIAGSIVRLWIKKLVGDI
jgi:hypothetical protein